VLLSAPPGPAPLSPLALAGLALGLGPHLESLSHELSSPAPRTARPSLPGAAGGGSVLGASHSVLSVTGSQLATPTGAIGPGAGGRGVSGSGSGDLQRTLGELAAASGTLSARLGETLGLTPSVTTPGGVGAAEALAAGAGGGGSSVVALAERSASLRLATAPSGDALSGFGSITAAAPSLTGWGRAAGGQAGGGGGGGAGSSRFGRQDTAAGGGGGGAGGEGSPQLGSTLGESFLGASLPRQVRAAGGRWRRSGAKLRGAERPWLLLRACVGCRAGQAQARRGGRWPRLFCACSLATSACLRIVSLSSVTQASVTTEVASGRLEARSGVVVGGAAGERGRGSHGLAGGREGSGAASLTATGASGAGGGGAGRRLSGGLESIASVDSFSDSDDGGGGPGAALA
jgi:hypothetical protein